MNREIQFQRPTATDGMAVSKLIANCPPLDINSVYCNLLQCHHFSATSIAAKLDGDLVGFISGYLIPGKPDTLFIWQVAVDAAARGMGVGLSMLTQLLQRNECDAVRFLETTITGDNAASWALFRRFADSVSAELTSAPLFEQDLHFNGEHSTELLVTIGPVQRPTG